MLKATDEFLSRMNEMFETRKKEIRTTCDETVIKGVRYYVSNSGDDENDGRTPQSAWKTLHKVSSAALLPGDGVFFKRGDLFRGSVTAKTGVTYGAYGVGEKPRFFGWDEDMADPVLWEETDHIHHIWKYKKKILDPGTLVFNHGEAHCRKLIPSYKNLQFVCREDESRPFIIAQEMTKDLDLFWNYDLLLTREPSKGEDFPIPVVRMGNVFPAGDLYLRCDKGNPGERYDSIEAVSIRRAFSVGNATDVTIDNLCIKYVCFGVAGGSRGLTVSNCEFGWIGGNIQTYSGGDPNYPQGGRGSVTRYGNAIEIYGSCENYTVSNCYIYESYDAGITHQAIAHKKVVMRGIRYTDNLIENCVYGIEYFLGQEEGGEESYMEDIVMSGNYIRCSGYGWGQQRHNTDTPALIKGWSYQNTARNFTIHNNIFDRSAYRMLHLVALKDEYCPQMHDNVYIQHKGGMIGQYGGNEVSEPDILFFDEKAEENVATIFRDNNAKIYMINAM